MKPKVCFEITRGFAWPIRLLQYEPDNFTVTYGKQVKSQLSYSDAATELGAAIMHALACEGNLDNSEDEAVQS